MGSFSKTMGPAQGQNKLFLRNVYNNQHQLHQQHAQDIDQLKQASANLR